MLSYYQTDLLKSQLCDRFTPDELVELLGVTTEEVFNKFLDECIEKDWSEHL